MREGSDALEVVERLATVETAIVRLAGGRAELADTLGVPAAAARTVDDERSKQAARLRDRFGRRRDAEFTQLAATLFGEPVAAPRRREHFVDLGVRVTVF